MRPEEWRPIPDFPGYEVSSLGRVRSFRRGATGRLVAQNNNPRSGYPQVGVYRAGKQVVTPVHVLVAAAFIGPRPEGWHTRHLDGSRDNNVPSNLAYGTPSENAQDRWEHGTMSIPRFPKRGACKHGHPLNEQNTRRRSTDGVHVCRVCDREQVAARRARRRSQVVSPPGFSERAA